jgi:hypothetical protein
VTDDKRSFYWYLDVFELRWDAVTLEDFGAFLTWLRSGDRPEVASIERRPARFSESTIAVRLAAAGDRRVRLRPSATRLPHDRQHTSEYRR